MDNELHALEHPFSRESRVKVGMIGHIDQGKRELMSALVALHGVEIVDMPKNSEPPKIESLMFELVAPPMDVPPMSFEKRPRRKGQRRALR